MKIYITFKTPNALEDAIENKCTLDTENEWENPNWTKPTEEEIEKIEEQKEIIREIGKKFIEYGECLTIEIDTKTITVKVIPVNS